MINKIKQSHGQRRSFLRNKIGIFFMGEEMEEERSGGRKQRVVSTGRTMRSNIIGSNLQSSSCQNKQSQWNLNSSQLQEEQFKTKLMANLKKNKLQHKQTNKTFIPSTSYMPKLKHKKSKQHSRRSLPTVTFNQNDNIHMKQQQRKISQIFIGSPYVTEMKEEEKYSKMNHVSILKAGGRKKIDSVMYLKKLKTKNQFYQTVITQSFMGNPDSQQDYASARPLFLRKDLASYKRSNTTLHRKSERKLSPKNHSKKKVKPTDNCRPWSATHSESDK